jgi:hypothetical protein
MQHCFLSERFGAGRFSRCSRFSLTTGYSRWSSMTLTPPLPFVFFSHSPLPVSQDLVDGCVKCWSLYQDLLSCLMNWWLFSVVPELLVFLGIRFPARLPHIQLISVENNPIRGSESIVLFFSFFFSGLKFFQAKHMHIIFFAWLLSCLFAPTPFDLNDWLVDLNDAYFISSFSYA